MISRKRAAPMPASQYLLDSNVVFHLANKAAGWERIEAKLNQIPKHRLLISSVVSYELQVKLLSSEGKIRLVALRLVAQLLSQFRVLPFTKEDASLAALIQAELMRTGNKIGERDLMTAAVALRHDKIVVTDNVSEFERVPTLLIENWRKDNEIQI